MDLTTTDNKFDHQGTRIIEYMMRDEEGFYNALQEEAGVYKAWIQWKDFKVFDSFCCTCPPKADGCHLDYCGDDYIQHKEFPRCIKDKNKMEVENPKGTIGKAILHLEDLSVLTFATLLEMNMGVSSKSIEEVKKEKDRKTTELVLIVLIYLLRDLGNVRYPLLSTSTLVRPYHGANEPGSLEAKAQQPGQGEARPSLPERTKLDRENLLKEFGLETVPGTANQGTGAKVDNMGQLQITDTSLSERPHKTALLLYRAPVSLTERDFLRILSPGKHIEGWKSHGGLEQIIPARNRKTLERTNGWLLLFSSPAAAAAYQRKVHKLRELLRDKTPFFPASSIDLPSNYRVPGSMGFALQDYTLTSPWQFPLVTAEFFPFGSWVNSCIRTHETITGISTKDGQQPKTSPSPSLPLPGYPVRMCISRDSSLTLTRKSLITFLIWDGKNRSVPWDLIDGWDKVTFLTNGKEDGSNPLGEKVQAKPRFGEYDVSNWRIMFRSASDARRFVRTWHMKEFPQPTDGHYCDPPPFVKAEALFWDDSF
ncbi:hypothetical protein MauCBS54593_007614 [Microsporum audouinii]